MGVLEERQTADALWRDEVDRDRATFRKELDEHMERLDLYDERFVRGNKRFEEGEERMTKLEGMVGENNAMTAAIQGDVTGLKTGLAKLTNDTDIIVKWVKNITGFNNVVNWLIALLLKISVVIVAAGIVYWFVHSGHLPKKAEREQQPAIYVEPARERHTGRRRRGSGSGSPEGLQQAGYARSMRVLYAEDFSLMVRTQPHRPLRARYGNPERLVLVN